MTALAIAGKTKNALYRFWTFIRDHGKHPIPTEASLEQIHEIMNLNKRIGAGNAAILLCWMAAFISFFEYYFRGIFLFYEQLFFIFLNTAYFLLNKPKYRVFPRVYVCHSISLHLTSISTVLYHSDVRYFVLVATFLLVPLFEKKYFWIRLYSFFVLAGGFFLGDFLYATYGMGEHPLSLEFYLPNFVQMAVAGYFFAWSIQEESEAKQGKLMHAKREHENILTHVGRGIATFGQDLSIHSSSKMFQTIMQGHLKGKSSDIRLDIPFLLTLAGLSEDMKSQVTSTLQLSFGEKPIALRLNQHMLPNELDIEGKVYDMDWSPIVDKGVIQSMILVMRDATRVRELKRKSEAAQRSVATCRCPTIVAPS